MDGFKDSTKMKYMGGGGMVDGYAKGGSTKPAMGKPMMAKGGAMMDKPKMGMGGSMTAKPMMDMGGAMMDGYAKGGDAKVGAKIAKVMGEFKKGDLRSGSKDGPKVGSPKQAMAIALSEAGKGKAPVKKAEGGQMSKTMAKEERSLDRTMPGKGRITERQLRMLEERFPIDTLVERLRSRMPSAGESVESGNRMSRMEAEEARAMGVFKKGGLAAMPKKGKR
jgi:hypothetical protein